MPNLTLLRAALMAVLTSANETWAQRSHREARVGPPPIFPTRKRARPRPRNRPAGIRAQRDANKRAQKARLLNTWIRRGKA